MVLFFVLAPAAIFVPLNYKNKFLGSLHLNNHTRRFKNAIGLLNTDVWFVLKCTFEELGLACK